MVNYDNFYQIKKVEQSNTKGNVWTHHTTISLILDKYIPKSVYTIRSPYWSFTLTSMDKSTDRLDLFNIVTRYYYGYFKNIKEGDWLYLGNYFASTLDVNIEDDLWQFLSREDVTDMNLINLVIDIINRGVWIR